MSRLFAINGPAAVRSSLLNFQSGHPYNITTGTDANGDGDFNDRPSYASASGPGIYSTPFGMLTANTVNGNVPRNLGTMPAQIHLDMNSAGFSFGAPGMARSA